MWVELVWHKLVLEMENRKKNRKTLRMTFTKRANKLAELLQMEEKNFHWVDVVLEKVTQTYDKMVVVDSEIYQVLLEQDAEKDELLVEMESADGYSKRYSWGCATRCSSLMTEYPARGAHRYSLCFSIILVKMLHNLATLFGKFYEIVLVK